MKWGNVFHYYLCCHNYYCILYNEKADEKPNRTMATLSPSEELTIDILEGFAPG